METITIAPNSTRLPTTHEPDYPSCRSTHVSLRIYPRTLQVDDVTRLLGLTPTRLHTGAHKLPAPDRPHVTWLFSSQGAVQSRDLRDHLDWLLQHLEPRAKDLITIAKDTDNIDIAVFWQSSGGHGGGPVIDPTQMTRLGALGLELWIDFYVPYSWYPGADKALFPDEPT